MQATDVPLDMTIKLTVNGAPQAITVDVRASLLDLLRERLHLTGTKKGCDHGQCGACTVHVNGRRVNSCLTLAVMHDGDRDHDHRGPGHPRRTCIPCKRHSLPATDTSADIARQARSCRPLHCSRNPAVPMTRR